MNIRTEARLLQPRDRTPPTVLAFADVVPLSNEPRLSA